MCAPLCIRVEPRMQPAHSPATASAQTVQSMRQRRGFPALCHFTKREWAAKHRQMDSQSASRTNATARKIVIDLSIMTAIGIVMAFIGPFGTFAEPLAYRLVSWVLFAWIGYAIYSPMSRLVDWLVDRLDLPRTLMWVFGVALATAPMTAIVWSMGFLPRPVPWPTLEQALTSYFYVFLVGGAVTAFFYLIETRKPKVAAPPPVEAASARVPALDPIPAQPKLINRIPPSLGSDIIALEMEDHYVRVHTALGSELVLMRLRDAITELDGINGRQVHRSWWVARGAVEAVEREGRNIRLKLARDIEAPVSRAQVSELKQAGWI